MGEGGADCAETSDASDDKRKIILVNISHEVSDLNLVFEVFFVILVILLREL